MGENQTIWARPYSRRTTWDQMETKSALGHAGIVVSDLGFALENVVLMLSRNHLRIRVERVGGLGLWMST